MSDSEDRLFQLYEKFDLHIQRFDTHEENEAVKFDKIMTAQLANTQAVSELTAQVSSLVDDTRVIIQLQNDIQGAARIGKGLQGFMLWLTKWGAIGFAIYSALRWIGTHFR